MEKLIAALIVVSALAGCSQTTRPADEKQAACAYAHLTADQCAKSKFGYRGTTLPSVTSPSI